MTFVWNQSEKRGKNLFLRILLTEEKDSSSSSQGDVISAGITQGRGLWRIFEHEEKKAFMHHKHPDSKRKLHVRIRALLAMNDSID